MQYALVVNFRIQEMLQHLLFTFVMFILIQ